MDLNQQLNGIYLKQKKGGRKREGERERTQKGESQHTSFMSGTGQSIVERSKENSARSRQWEALEGNWPDFFRPAFFSPAFFTDYIVRKQR